MTYIPASSHGNVLTPAAAAALALGPPAVVLGAQSVGWSHTGDTAETKLASVAIPANAIGLGQIDVEVYFSVNNNADAKTVRIRFGAANDLTGTTVLSANIANATTWQSKVRMGNAGTSSQVFFPGSSVYSTSTNTAGASAIDTTAQTFVVFSGQLATGTDTVTLLSYRVLLVPPV